MLLAGVFTGFQAYEYLEAPQACACSASTAATAPGPPEATCASPPHPSQVASPSFAVTRSCRLAWEPLLHAHLSTSARVCLGSGATVFREDSRFQCSHVTSADGGVVILDDVFNADWPETYLGLALYMEGYLYEQLQVRHAPLSRLGGMCGSIWMSTCRTGSVPLAASHYIWQP
jgi:hypothetical protein